MHTNSRRQEKENAVLKNFTQQVKEDFRHNATFNGIVHSLVAGESPYKIIELLLIANKKSSDELLEIYKNGTPKMIITVTPEKFDEIQNKRKIDSCTTCKHNKPGIEPGMWCINNCIKGSMYEQLS